MHAAVALIILICFIGGIKTEVKPIKGEMIITVAENNPLRLRQIITPDSEILNSSATKLCTSLNH